jgi:two-component system chemotaxis response regulator CheB
MEEIQMNKLVVIGGSAGSLRAVFSVFSHLERGFPFSILLVLHRQSGQDNQLDEILHKRTGLPAKEVEEKESIQPGYIYICPPDYHVLIEDDYSFSLDVSEKVNYSRPSIDVIFMSAADVYGKFLAGIILSGANADGAEGLAYIKSRGGMTIVQDPADAAVAYMPEKAIQNLAPDQVLDAEAIGRFLKTFS